MRCLCETNEPTQVGEGDGSATMSICYVDEGAYEFEVGGWFMYVASNYEEVTVGPVFYCPMCGREL